MQTNEIIPSSRGVREYVKNRHAVWTTLPTGGTVNKREVVIKGNNQQGSVMEVARHVASRCSPWATRVQVIKWEKDEYIAWLNIKNDEIYEFVEHFNTTKCVKNAKAFIKRGVDNDKKLVMHGVEGKTTEEIARLVGTEKVQQVVKNNNTAFVTLKSLTYAQALIGDSSLSVKVSKYTERRDEPMVIVNRRLETTRKQLTLMVESLSRKMNRLELELKKLKENSSTQQGESQRKTHKRTAKKRASKSRDGVEATQTLEEETDNWESVLRPDVRDDMQDGLGHSPQRRRSKSTSAIGSRSAFEELAEMCLVNGGDTPVKSNGKRCSTTQLDEQNQRKRQLVNTPIRLSSLTSRMAPEAEVPRRFLNQC